MLGQLPSPKQGHEVNGDRNVIFRNNNPVDNL